MEELILWFLYVFFPLVGIVTTLLMPWLPFVLWKKLMPKPARTLFWAARRKQPPIIVAHDSGRADIALIHERRGSGVVMTDKGKYKLLPRYVSRLPESKDEKTEAKKKRGKETENNPNGIKAKLAQIKEKFIADYSAWIVKRANLVGLNLPIFFGYSGKLCLLNPEALALYEAGDLMIKTEDVDLFNPNSIEGKSITDALQPLMLLDPRQIKEIIYKGFDESQIAAIVVDSEMIGLLGRGFKRYLPIIGIIMIIIAVILGLMFLPQILQTIS